MIRKDIKNSVIHIFGIYGRFILKIVFGPVPEGESPDGKGME